MSLREEREVNLRASEKIQEEKRGGESVRLLLS